jgi:hypothetical protein
MTNIVTTEHSTDKLYNTILIQLIFANALELDIERLKRDDVNESKPHQFDRHVMRKIVWGQWRKKAGHITML